MAELVCDPGALASLVRAGDALALDRMTRCYGDRLLAVGRRTCRCEEDAHDAVQDALLAAGNHLAQFRGDGRVDAWLVRMVVNACHRMRRGRKNAPELRATDVDVASPADSPETEAERREVIAAIGLALLALPARDRALLLLVDAEGHAPVDVARDVGMTAGALRTRLSRARGRIREALERRAAGESDGAP